MLAPAMPMSHAMAPVAIGTASPAPHMATSPAPIMAAPSPFS
jgi:hypothetical protein